MKPVHRPTDTGLQVQVNRRLANIERRRKGHTETKTFIIGGPVDTDLYVPPFFVGIDYDGDTPEWKVLIGFRAVLETGSATLKWLLNGEPVASGQSVDADPLTSIYDIDAVDLALGDVIQVEITSATDAMNLSAAAFMVTAAA
jgi:hypothetical protein